MSPPDINTMPVSLNNNSSSSPTSHLSQHPPTTASRRASQMTGTPLLPGVQTSGFSQQDEIGVPMRHPRPLTAAELHLELEKEQEAVVNRLARELTALRAQHSASVASNASSTHSNAVDHTQPHSATNDIAPSQPTTARRHRSSSSSLSIRSVASHTATTAPGVSQASVDRARDATGIRSRDNSLVSGAISTVSGVGGGVTMPAPGRSRAPSACPSPAPGSMGGEQYFNGSRARRESNASLSGRIEEMERARAQLEIARKENEMLVARIRELEGQLKDKDKDKKVVTDASGGRDDTNGSAC